jgi:hypothetical protein
MDGRMFMFSCNKVQSFNLCTNYFATGKHQVISTKGGNV